MTTQRTPDEIKKYLISVVDWTKSNADTFQAAQLMDISKSGDPTHMAIGILFMDLNKQITELREDQKKLMFIIDEINRESDVNTTV